jgi:hypothetical protein
MVALYVHFASCHTNIIMHFGNVVDSRIEGMNGAMKLYLSSKAASDFEPLTDHLATFTANQLDRVAQKEGDDVTRIQNRLRDCPIFAKIIHLVSTYTLEKAIGEYAFIRRIDQEGEEHVTLLRRLSYCRRYSM